MPGFLRAALRNNTHLALVNTRTGALLATRVEGAFDSAARRRGLLGRERLEHGHAMIIAPCGIVHTCFMQFAIDILFADREGAVVGVRTLVPPWRIAAAWRGFATIELPAGSVARTGTRLGDRLIVAPARN